MILFIILVASIFMMIAVALLCAISGSMAGIILIAEPVICAVIIVCIIKAFRKRRKKNKKD